MYLSLVLQHLSFQKKDVIGIRRVKGSCGRSPWTRFIGKETKSQRERSLLTWRRADLKIPGSLLGVFLKVSVSMLSLQGHNGYIWHMSMQISLKCLLYLCTVDQDILEASGQLVKFQSPRVLGMRGKDVGIQCLKTTWHLFYTWEWYMPRTAQRIPEHGVHMHST